MMQKLIDAYKLEREMYRRCIDTDEEIKKGRAKWDSGLWIRYKVFEDVIALAAPVDAVKPAHWEIDEKRYGNKDPHCSICRAILEGDADKCRNNYYCYHCGAKMDEDEWQEPEEPEINPCRGCADYEGYGRCKSNGGCGADLKGERSEDQ